MKDNRLGVTGVHSPDEAVGADEHAVGRLAGHADQAPVVHPGEHRHRRVGDGCGLRCGQRGFNDAAGLAVPIAGERSHFGKNLRVLLGGTPYREVRRSHGQREAGASGQLGGGRKIAEIGQVPVGVVDGKSMAEVEGYAVLVGYLDVNETHCLPVVLDVYHCRVESAVHHDRARIAATRRSDGTDESAGAVTRVCGRIVEAELMQAHRQLPIVGGRTQGLKHG
jgi:hypothetical protein